MEKYSLDPKKTEQQVLSQEEIEEKRRQEEEKKAREDEIKQQEEEAQLQKNRNDYLMKSLSLNEMDENPEQYSKVEEEPVKPEPVVLQRIVHSAPVKQKQQNKPEVKPENATVKA
jgi:hypothetical protein